MKDKLTALETYRGFAAIMIAAVHFNVNWSLFNNSIVNGHYVQLFFTLSGFVMYLNYNEKITNFTLLKKFIFRRQDKGLLFARNGAAIYIVKYDHVNKFLFGGKIINFTMNEEDSIDIDSLADIKIAKKILKRIKIFESRK